MTDRELAIDEQAWDKGKTEELVMSRFGKKQWIAIRPSLRSCTERLDHARIHYHDVRKLFDNFSEKWLVDLSLMRASIEEDDEFGDAKHEFMLRTQAYVAAFLQSLHSLPDIVAHMVHYAFGMNLGPQALRPREVTHPMILSRLKSENHSGSLVKLFEELSNGGVFAHISAAVNHSKHRGVILAGVNEHLAAIGRARYTVVLQDFNFEDKRRTTRYQQVEFFGYFGAEFDRLSKLVIQFGAEVNAALSLPTSQPDQTGGALCAAA